MRILTIDVGTGTQDIYLYDSRVDMENGFKLVIPSPTMIVHQRLKEATRRGEAIALSGVTMGGGPSHWATRDHAKAGYRVYATPEAARTFDDDLDRVQAEGIQIVSEEEIATLPETVVRLALRDFDFAAIGRAFGEFGVGLGTLDAVAVAVFDHGAAPPEISDRQFRFDYLDEQIQARNRLSSFAFLRDNVPAAMTRLQAVVDSANGVDAPLVVMDTAPAAVLGATLDLRVLQHPRVMIANVGNFHTLAFRLGATRQIEGVFEHHTGLLDRRKLEDLLRSLADGSLKHSDVFGDHGHGALVYGDEALPLGDGEFDVVVTGPRRTMLRMTEDRGRKTDFVMLPSSVARPRSLRPYFPAPYGDMMITGCFGLLAAVADVLPDLGEPIRASLRGTGGRGTPPWEIE